MTFKKNHKHEKSIAVLELMYSRSLSDVSNGVIQISEKSKARLQKMQHDIKLLYDRQEFLNKNFRAISLITNQLDDYKAEIKKTESQKENRMLGIPLAPLKNEVKEIIEQLQLKIKEGHDKQYRFEEKQYQSSYILKLELQKEMWRINGAIKRKYNKAVSFIFSAQTEELKRQEQFKKDAPKREKTQRDEALATAHMKKSREAAESIKRSLKKTTYCPYCGKNLGDKPHADHIYPIARGGLSVAKNMVYICQGCNIKKSDLTLVQFIKKYNFDQDVIFARLEVLEKDF